MEKAGLADSATLAGHETLEDMLKQHLPPEKLKARTLACLILD